jgi:hypothetical protein
LRVWSRFIKLLQNGPFHLISVHPLSRIHVFHGYTPEEFQAQNLLPLKNSKIPSSKPSTPEEFQAQNLLPLKNSKIPSSKPSTPEEFQAQNPLPLKNSKLKTLYP